MNRHQVGKDEVVDFTWQRKAFATIPVWSDTGLQAGITVEGYATKDEFSVRV